jgi:hypothetical protein
MAGQGNYSKAVRIEFEGKYDLRRNGEEKD